MSQLQCQNYPNLNLHHNNTVVGFFLWVYLLPVGKASLFFFFLEEFKDLILKESRQSDSLDQAFAAFLMVPPIFTGNSVGMLSIDE